ncbi:Cobalamin biosynthesis protein CobT VWA domain-containing protein [Paenibacillus sp. UNCCL117]|uniref:vWA domain-containing protein n=1 Tax=unclassified Paenibacillus TaxID=185978 RepID=UPI000883F27C|nr:MULTISPECIES: nitric oxide reductase activation protein NorD [unclassified Paenibacillus]SDD57192.1 Cobalamin biosynthesis protein CobT VWA domain-containing protein [Paenibacillus sp. cl123]SFW51229.1 Cobalamin biosynthesis protein CobT VWA domain-containing protein [Paenibacillus sp. UNCCL117]
MAEVEADDGKDEEGMVVTKSPDSDPGSYGKSEQGTDQESPDSGEEGKPVYHQTNPETMPADDAQRERDFRKKLNQEAREAVTDSIHKKVRLIVHRPGYNDEDQREYTRLSRELMPVIRDIVRKTLPLLEHETASEFARNHYFGSKFQADSLAYRDFRYFARKRPPTENPSLAVGLRVDESASMSAHGRLEAAKRAVIAVYEFCRMCDIPVLIYGDTADVSRLEQMSVFAYADYDKPDPGDKYRLMGIRARSNNRDGMALRIMAERLAASPRQTRLLISMSDGQPKALEDYTGNRAAEDIRQTIAEFERKGVSFIAAAIGQDKEVIRHIYGQERCLDLTRLSGLPAELVRMIARHL